MQRHFASAVLVDECLIPSFNLLYHSRYISVATFSISVLRIDDYFSCMAANRKNKVDLFHRGADGTLTMDL
uniref:Uncharacterized protein n=1 Tax=Arundo donax TaxID=35708 RepID=A0A0A8YJM0_ARUDO